TLKRNRSGLNTRPFSRCPIVKSAPTSCRTASAIPPFASLISTQPAHPASPDRVMTHRSDPAAPRDLREDWRHEPTQVPVGGTVATIDPAKINAFARLMTEKLDNGDTNARKVYIRSIVDARSEERRVGKE